MQAESPHQPVLDRLIALGEDLARQVHAAAGKDFPLDQATVAFDRVARAVRRTIALSCRLQQEPPLRDRTAPARREIIRRVEDAIARADRPALDAELRERLDAPELDDEIGTRPTIDIITDILRDLGLSAGPWPRRTPSDIKALHAKAGRRPPFAPAGNGRVEGETHPNGTSPPKDHACVIKTGSLTPPNGVG